MVDFKKLNIIRSIGTEWSTCAECKHSGIHKAYYRGVADPDIMFIGPMLYLQDSVTKKPISGLQGKLLDNLCKKVGLKSYGVTTLTACPFSFQYLPSTPREPTPDEVESCASRLEDVTEAFIPSFYVALGSLAKKYPPTGVSYALTLHAPSQWSVVNGQHYLNYKRDHHKLKKFIQENNLG